MDGYPSVSPIGDADTDVKSNGRNHLTIRYGVRWDGRGRPRPVRLAAMALTLAALVAPASARADDQVGRSAAWIAGGVGLTGLTTPDGRGVDVALVDSGVMPVGRFAEPGRVVSGSSERGDADLRNLDTFGHGTHLSLGVAGDDYRDGRRWSGRRWSGAAWIDSPDA